MLKWYIPALWSFFANAWSAFSYHIWGMPSDKLDYWAEHYGLSSPSQELEQSWVNFRSDRSFHHAKDLLVEWAKVWPQRAVKILALAGVTLAVFTLAIGFSLGLAL